MSEIYIVYAKQNKKIANKLFELLSLQWDVWIDKKIVGSFRKTIENELPKSRCVVAVNSIAAREKDEYAAELQIAKDHKIPIIPARLDDSKLPYPFSEDSHVDMHGWAGEIDHEGFIDLKYKISSIVAPRVPPQRPHSIADGRIPLPNLFMSVSSFETQITPIGAVSVLRAFESKSILVSAYDLVKRNKKDPQGIIDELREYQNNGGFILLDSGNYEKGRLKSSRWEKNQLWEVLDKVPHDWAFCFDVFNPKHKPEMAISEIISAVEREKGYSANAVLPIVHAPKLKKGGYKLAHLSRIVREISERLQPPLIAVPERELGEGIIARTIAIQGIRKELDKLPFYQPLHILGTGNPWTIPVFVAAGADSFDGLEWCRMIVNRDKHRLHHFQHFDFFAYQKGQAESQIVKIAMDGNEYQAKVVFHNLDYYCSFMNDLRSYLLEDNLEAFMSVVMGGHAVKLLKQQIQGLFK